jgi:hypothetical protein
MGVLSERFREVTVILEGSAPSTDLAGKDLPPSWLQYEATDSMVRFVHSACTVDTAVEVKRMFPGARSLSMEAMPLRAIFLAIAKSRRGRDEAAGRSGR